MSEKSLICLMPFWMLVMTASGIEYIPESQLPRCPFHIVFAFTHTIVMSRATYTSTEKQ
jgi:hypothetical protein